MYDLMDAELLAYKTTQDRYGYSNAVEKVTECFVNLKSVNYKEFYQAYSVGIKPSMIAIVDFFDYEEAFFDGEEPSRLKIGDDYYKIIRAYNTEVFDYVELTLERDTRNGEVND